MNRKALLPLLALLLAPAALAHDPPGPVSTCEAATARHDYVGHVERPAHRPTAVPLTLDGSTEACDPADPASRADYDGDLDFGLGGARLFVLDGDGATGGVLACYGAPSAGHHSAEVRAWDVGGFGPQLVVSADASRFPPASGPDCGDGYLEACEPRYWGRKSNPFPYNVVKDVVMDVYYSLFGPDGTLCIPQDRHHAFWSSETASGGLVPFPPGADGTYLVEIAPDLNLALFPIAGHVWTE